MIELPGDAWKPPSRLAAAVIDWAGTTVDFGSRAPVTAMTRAFELAGVAATEGEVRKPMGRAKPDHIRDVLLEPGYATRWAERHGRAPVDADADAIYDQFLKQQAACIADLSEPIAGCVEAVDACRELGLRIGASTGYTNELLAPVAARAADVGYTPDVCLCADDLQPGRPAPWLCVENARRLGVYPLSAVVKVDDTPAGVTAGRNAGAWAVGVVVSGNEVGRSEAGLARLDSSAREALFEVARRRLADAGAHYLIDTIAELPEAVERINGRLARGETP